MPPQTPPESELSLESLAEQLGAGATTEVEKARSVYNWITENISYDVDKFFGNSRPQRVDARAVLASRRSLCEGYATLMLSLCELLGIECKKIGGYSKGFGYNPKDWNAETKIDPKSRHAWNAVKLVGEWRFIDSTWGAGRINDNKEFTRAKTDFYFLQEPEIFIDAHFPLMNSDLEESKKWQLLDEPIDLDTFHRRVKRDKDCIEQQVELVSHTEALIDVDEEVTLVFRGTGKLLTGFSAQFVNLSTGETVSSGRHVATVLDHRTNEAWVTARPPTQGVHWELRVFGSTEADASTMQQLVTYMVRAARRTEQPEFPDFSSHYGLHVDPEKFGFTAQLRTSQKFCIRTGNQQLLEDGELELKLPVAHRVLAKATFLTADDEDNSKFCLVESEDGVMKISLRMHQAGFHRLELFCQRMASDDGDKLDLVATFLIECSSPMQQPRPFPEFGPFALESGVTLVRPRDGELPAESEVQFELVSPALNAIYVSNTVHRKCGSSFTFKVLTGAAGADLKVFGALSESATSFKGLFVFRLVDCDES